MPVQSNCEYGAKSGRPCDRPATTHIIGRAKIPRGVLEPGNEIVPVDASLCGEHGDTVERRCHSFMRTPLYPDAIPATR